jgi:predicted DNA-binding protein YlxM (UPF0122 family)
MLIQDNEENRKVIRGLLYDLKVVANLMFDYEKKLQFPSFHPEGITDEEKELYEQLKNEYETHLIFKLAEAKGLFKHTNMN